MTRSHLLVLALGAVLTASAGCDRDTDLDDRVAAIAAPATATGPRALPSPADPDTIARGYLACWSAVDAHQWTQLGACFTSDVRSERIGSAAGPATGADAAVARAHALAVAAPDLRATPSLVLVHGRTVVGVVQLRGTQTGPLDGPGWALPPDGRAAAVTIVHGAELGDDGRARATWMIADAAPLRAQLLGDAPPEPTPRATTIAHTLGDDVERANLAAVTAGAPSPIEAWAAGDYVLARGPRDVTITELHAGQVTRTWRFAAPPDASSGT